jgi:hypothetical protein
MKFNSEIFKRQSKCFRASWGKDHYLTYDGENFIEHKGNKSHVWYWEHFNNAINDIMAEDWGYIEKDER